MNWVNLDTQRAAVYRPSSKIDDKISDLPFTHSTDKNPIGVTSPAQRKTLTKAKELGWNFDHQDTTSTSYEYINAIYCVNEHQPEMMLRINRDGQGAIFNINTPNVVKQYSFKPKKEINNVKPERTGVYKDEWKFTPQQKKVVSDLLNRGYIYMGVTKEKRIMLRNNFGEAYKIKPNGDVINQTDMSSLQESKLFIENIQAMKKLSELFNEKWDKDVEIKDTGENTDKSIAQLKKEKEGADTKTKQQKNFAIRAKEGWPKGEIKEDAFSYREKNSPDVTRIASGIDQNAAMAKMQQRGHQYDPNSVQPYNPSQSATQQTNEIYDKPDFGELDAPAIRRNKIRGIIRMDAKLDPQDPPTGMEAQQWIKLCQKLDDNSVDQIYKNMKAEYDQKFPRQMGEGDFGEVDNGMYAGNTVSGAFSAKNTPEKAPVMETKEKEIDGSTVKKKIRYKMTEDQKKMFDELRMIQESIKRLDGNKKLLY